MTTKKHQGHPQHSAPAWACYCDPSGASHTNGSASRTTHPGQVCRSTNLRVSSNESRESFLPISRGSVGEVIHARKRSSRRDPTSIALWYEFHWTPKYWVGTCCGPSVSANSSSNFLGKNYPQANRTSTTSARYGCQNNLSWRSGFSGPVEFDLSEVNHICRASMESTAELFFLAML